jgi:hypothetical protein
MAVLVYVAMAQMAALRLLPPPIGGGFFQPQLLGDGNHGSFQYKINCPNSTIKFKFGRKLDFVKALK